MVTSIRLDPETERRINALASQTGRTKAYYLREMIERSLNDVEYFYLAGDGLARVRKASVNDAAQKQLAKQSDNPDN